ncbi:HPr family phosphocarrier protein [Klebsiella pneumoniae]|nr:HPr family phosphocarrier protein [Klebsiella pneumoniae]
MSLPALRLAGLQLLAKACAQYQSRIEMIYDGKVIKGKSIMSILGAGIKGEIA